MKDKTFIKSHLIDTKFVYLFKMKFILIFIFIFLFTSSYVVAIETNSTHAVVYDYQTNEILFQKNGNGKTPPASTTKILTCYIVFDKINNGSLSLDDKFLVSEKAYKQGGSSMFLEPNTKVTVKDLLFGIIVQSGNDASIVVAENISGSEKNFANLMNDYAKKIGMNNSNFVNSSGWPHPKHYSTMYDLSILSKSLINDFPELYKIFSETRFKFNKIMQPNRNVLLKYYDGVDGLKTGYVKDSGYGIVVSSIKDNRRIIVSINGLKSKKSRTEEATRLLDWAYRETEQITLIKKGQSISKSDVWLGKDKNVELISGADLITTLTSNQKTNINAKIVYEKPIKAPIKENQKIGKIIINIENKDKIEIPLLAKNEVKQINPIFRIFSAISYLIFGSISNE